MFKDEIQRSYRVLGCAAESQNYFDIENWYKENRIDDVIRHDLHRLNRDLAKEYTPYKD